MLDDVARKIANAHTIYLSTHRHGDGDGIGAQMGLLRGLTRLGKKVRAINVDAPAPRYSFLGTEKAIEVFEELSTPLERADLTLVLDTNDGRLLEPLFSKLKEVSGEILFIDHHAVLKKGPSPTQGSWIDLDAASTGELCYLVLKKLFLADGLEFDAEIARALYTSTVFDTQLFKFIRSSSRSHLMAADLLQFELHPEVVHRALFATYSIEKLNFLTSGLSKIEYSESGRIAFVSINREALKNVAPDDTGEIIDMVMNVETVEVAALLREEASGGFKLSLRSKGQQTVLPLAESFGGGGHAFAAGAYLTGTESALREQILEGLRAQLYSQAKSQNMSGAQ